MQWHIGCCGFPMAQSRYFASFKAVEVQATFYDPPHAETLTRWRQKAPPDFVFAVKAWQLITHEPGSPTYRRLRRPLPGPAREFGSFRPTDGVWAAWRATQEAAAILGARAIVFQCPASFRPSQENVENLRRFFGRLKRGSFLLAWEPRGDWPPELVATLCAELDLVHAVDPFASRAAASWPVQYFRLHGGTGYRHRYSDDELMQLARWCSAPGTREVFVFFNNLAMAEDAARFRSLVGG